MSTGFKEFMESMFEDRRRYVDERCVNDSNKGKIAENLKEFLSKEIYNDFWDLFVAEENKCCINGYEIGFKDGIKFLLHIVTE